MSDNKERIDYLDIAKAITIFLVMMGHIGPSDSMFLYRRIIYSFHMPLFLMVSGVVSQRHRHGYSSNTWKEFFKKNAFALLIPYFFWGLLYSHFSYQNVLRLLYASWKTIVDSGTVLALWYLIGLFMARFEMEAVLSLSRKFNMDRHLFAPIPFVIGILLPDFALGYPWELNVSFIALGFLLLGYALKDLLKNFVKKVFQHTFSCLLSSQSFSFPALLIGAPILN